MSGTAEKWMAQAEKTLDLMLCHAPDEAGSVREASIRDIATALAQAEREGMKRAADKAMKWAKDLKPFSQANPGALLDGFVAAILSEAGEG